MLTAISALVIMSAVFGLLLGWASHQFKIDEDPLADEIDAILPQTQCGQCGFAGCRPYAEAMASGDAEINRCPPGGEAVVNELAALLNVEAKPLEGEHSGPIVAWVDEQTCIGCTKCIQSCPVDAIVGAAKAMHTIIAAECTGCKLCVEPCPVDCIHMVPVAQTLETWTWPEPPQPLRNAA
jgi:electron transport complex protein RnfB